MVSDELSRAAYRLCASSRKVTSGAAAVFHIA